MYQLMARAGVSKGGSWPITEVPLMIGRESTCDVRIPDPVVSRQHCEIALAGQRICLKDLGSLNPTRVNGRLVKTCTLEVGDEVRVGRAVFFVAKIGPEAQPEKGLEPNLATETMAEQESLYLAPLASGSSHGEHLPSDDDLNELFRLSRSLSRISSEEMIIQSVGESIFARFRPDQSWLLLKGLESDRLRELPGERKGTSPPPRDAMIASLGQRKGTLESHQTAAKDERLVVCTMSAPLYLGDHDIGVLAFSRCMSECAYDRHDLHFLVALAHIVAPFFKAIERVHQLEAENERLRSAQEEMVQLVGSSKAMADIHRMIRMVAPTEQSLLILGATGTGKELVATLAHRLSARANGPLTTVNCAAIPRELFESEFFGHEKGAFTGATQRKIGLLEESDGGTLFLDEIGDLALEHQARILRAVETGRFRRVGGEEEVHADFRVIAATNKDLPVEIEMSRFRQDLYHRLRAVEVKIPPLSQRRSDIPELADFFLRFSCEKVKQPLRKFSSEAVEYLVNATWPGNVRQLKNVVEAANSIARSETIEVDDLKSVAGTQQIEKQPMRLADLERQHILNTLEFTNGSIQEAARLLGIGRSTLYNKLEHYNVRI